MSAGAGRFLVTIRTWRKIESTRYADYTAARDAGMRARAKGYDARLTTDGEPLPDEEPEHRGDRRRFLVWAVLAGFAPSERLTERIVADINAESSGGI